MRYIVSLSKSIGVDKNLKKLTNALGSRDKVHFFTIQFFECADTKKIRIAAQV